MGAESDDPAIKKLDFVRFPSNRTSCARAVRLPPVLTLSLTFFWSHNGSALFGIGVAFPPPFSMHPSLFPWNHLRPPPAPPQPFCNGAVSKPIRVPEPEVATTSRQRYLSQNESRNAIQKDDILQWNPTPSFKP